MSELMPTREIYHSCHNVLTAMLGMAIYDNLPEQEKEQLDDNFRQDLLKALEHHDISKYRWEDKLLFGERKPTKKEWDQKIKPHPVHGATIMKCAGESNSTINGIILCHHVRYDGEQFEYFNPNGKINAVHGGYPRGYIGASLPIGPRIANLADSVCAMRENRPYRKRVMEMEEIMEHIVTEAGGQFDPLLVNVFTNISLEDLARIETESVTVEVLRQNMINRGRILRQAGLLKPNRF